MNRRPNVLMVLMSAVWLALPGLAAADNPGVGQVIVPGDHVLPGQSFEITGYDLDPGAALDITLASADVLLELGSTKVADDGTIRVSANVPATFPVGYAQLVATEAIGDGTWSTSILIGERAEGPAAQQPLDDNSTVRNGALLVLAVGVVIFLAAGARYLRR